PRLAVVAEELAAVGRASRLGLARGRKARELATVRREIATRRQENAGLESELAAGEPLMGSGLLELVDLELPGGPSAAARARTEIRQAIEALMPEDDSAAVTLLTSELVTNAVIHAQQPDDASIGLRIIRSQERLRVEVIDSGPGFDPAARRRPEPG